MKSHTLTSDGKYQYGFTESGLFTLLDKKGEPLYPKGLPLLNKILSHLIYITLWIVLIVVTCAFLPLTVLHYTNPLFMALLVLNLFFLGCRLTSLMFVRPLRPLFFPPLWMKITRDISRGAGMELLEKHGLSEHEGLLANLRLASALRTNKS